MAFALLRPRCVALLQVTRGGDEIALVRALDGVLSALGEVSPLGALSPSLVHYIFFPVSQLLTASNRGIQALADRVKWRVFAILTALARDWWNGWTATAVGTAAQSTALAAVPQWQVWEQLLLLSSMAMGSGFASASETTREHMASFTAALLAPRFAAPAPAPGEWEWDGVSDLPDLDTLDERDGPIQLYPTTHHVRAALAVPSCVGALSHLLKLSLDASLCDVSPALRMSLLQVARHTSFTWLAGDAVSASFGGDDKATAYARWHVVSSEHTQAVAQRITPILPGMASALLKLVIGNSVRVASDAVAYATTLLATLLVMCIGDSVTQALRSSDTPAPRVPSSLEDIVNAVHVAPDGDLTRAPPTPDDDSDASTEVASETSASTAATSIVESAVRDTQWLRRTMRMVIIVVNTLEAMSESENSGVALALVDSTDALLTGSAATLEWAWELFAPDISSPQQPTRTLMRMLLDAYAQRHVNQVIHRADAALRAHAPARLDLLDAALADSFDALPRAIRRVLDGTVERLATRIASAAVVLSGTAAHAQLQNPGCGIPRIFGPSGGMSQWGDGIDAVLTSDGKMPQWSNAASLRPSFAPLEPRAIDALGRMWFACGTAVVRLVAIAAQDRIGVVPTGFRSVFFAPLYFLDTAAPVRTSHTAALFAADELLRGAASRVTDPSSAAFLESREGTPARRLAVDCGRGVAELVLEVWERDVDEEHAPMEVAAPAADVPEVRRGLAEAPLVEKTGALSLDYVNSAALDKKSDAPQAAATERAVQRRDAALRLGDMQLLSILASAAELMGTAFRPLLLRALYVCISALDSGDAMLHEAAQFALERIATASAYPTVGSCVLHNADYVLGTASHLLVAGLGHELYRSVTSNSAPKVLLSARAAPWVLVQVIRLLGPPVLPLVEDALDEVLDALDRYHGYPDVSLGLLEVLAHIMGTLAGDAPEKMLEHTREPDVVAEFSGWLTGAEHEHEREPAHEPVLADKDETDDDPGSHTRTIIVQILTRAVPFLSHESPRLRITSLDMLRDGVRILGIEQRHTDLYPILHRAWPFLMARLGTSINTRLGSLQATQDPLQAMSSEKDANVWMHAAACVGEIGLYASDVFGRQILEQAWPRFERILAVIAHEPRGLSTRARAGEVPVRLHAPHSAHASIVQHISEALGTVVGALGTHTESRALWSIAAHPQLLDALDMRQPRAVHAAGLRLQRMIRHADACVAWLVERSAQTGYPLAFLERPALRPESLYITEL